MSRKSHVYVQWQSRYPHLSGKRGAVNRLMKWSTVRRTHTEFLHRSWHDSNIIRIRRHIWIQEVLTQSQRLRWIKIITHIHRNTDYRWVLIESSKVWPQVNTSCSENLYKKWPWGLCRLCSCTDALEEARTGCRLWFFNDLGLLTQ